MGHSANIQSTALNKVAFLFTSMWRSSFIFIFLLLFLRVVKLVWVYNLHVIESNFIPTFLWGVIYDLQWAFYIIGIVMIVGLLIGFFSIRLMRICCNFIYTILVVVELALIVYFTKMVTPLGVDLYGYSMEDIAATVQASGELNFLNFAIGLIGFGVLYLIFFLGKPRIISLKNSGILSLSLFLSLLFFNSFTPQSLSGKSEMERNLTLNNSFYLYSESYSFFAKGDNVYFDFFLPEDNFDRYLIDKNLTDPNYPFLHQNQYPDVLGPYFDQFDQSPDLVFILVEGLGKAYSGKDAYLGSFTPFLDSLSDHSLYWKNNLSSTGRTFGLLPGVFGSLPFGTQGFMELPSFPDHLSLISVLKENGYHVNYHIGADKKFDNAAAFLEYQQVDRILDISSFDKDFKPMPNKSGFSWGYSDKELFENGIRKLNKNPSKPQLTIFQTQTSHDPFVIPNEDLYIKKFEALIEKRLQPSKIEAYKKYTLPYASIIYADEAIKEFFASYKEMPNYENTIFLITGDHRLPEIPIASSIDRFHVPLMIFSPKLNSSRVFSGISSHFEITPTILAYMEQNFGGTYPESVAWKGYVLDTASHFRSKISHPLMRNKNQLLDYVDGEYFLSGDQLYKISDNLNIDPIDDSFQKQKLEVGFSNYKENNAVATKENRIIPPALLKLNRERN